MKILTISSYWSDVFIFLFQSKKTSEFYCNIFYDNQQYKNFNLGQIIFKIKELEKYREGRIIKNTFPKKVWDLANKEYILINLK